MTINNYDTSIMIENVIQVLFNNEIFNNYYILIDF